MKKRILAGLAVLALTLFLASCADRTYEAYVTVVNIGNVPMNAWVEGDGTKIEAYDSQTWAITLDSSDEARTVLAEAEPVDGEGSDEIEITVFGDRDVQTWLVGWDATLNSGPQKKKSTLLHGPAPK